MLLQHRGPDGVRDLTVQIRDPDATVADLCHALAPDRPVTALSVDGRLLAPATPLDRSTIGHGSVIRRSDDPEEPAPTETASTPVIDVVGGLDTGRRLHPPEGTSVLGRPVDETADVLGIFDPTVSRRQAIITRHGDRITIRGVDATNPTLLAGVPVESDTPWPMGVVLTIGSARLRLVTAPSAPPGRDPLEGPPPWTLHRVPDDEPDEDPEPVAVPEEPDRLPTVTPIGVAAVLGSLLLATVLVLVLGNWMYALFAGFGPVLALLSSIDSRRRRRAQRRRDGRRRRAELERFGDELLRARELRRRALVHRLPSAAAAIRLATGGPGGREPDPSCWRRRPSAVDAHTVRLGRGCVPWSPPLDRPIARVSPDVASLIERLGPIPAAPVALPLEPGRPIALRGPTAVCRAIARSILLQASVLHGPADLQIALLLGRDRSNPWRWATWLPHTIGTGGSPMLGVDLADQERIVEQLTPTDADADPPSAGPRRLVLIDDPDGLDRRRGPSRTALRMGTDPDGEIAVIVLVGDGRVPAGCRDARVSPTGSVRLADVDGIVADGMAVDVAASAAHALARAFDPEVDDDSRSLPESVDLIDLVGPERLDRRAIAARWRAGGADPPPLAVLGSGPDGPVSIDLTADGPHALVAGTTGSGKSELLRSLIVSLAIGSSPDHLCFVLIDFKGGSAFDACARLPHTIGVVSDLDEHLADRALRCLEAELRHRETRLREVGVADVTEHRLLPHDPDAEPLPRLVVVIDEFATLAAELPDFVDALVGIAQRGRSLGVHLVLATQRPSGAVNDNIRANTALRIALRVQDRADSDDVVGAPDAAGLPRNRPGRAVVRLGPGELITVQSAYVSGDALTGDLEPVTVTPLGAASRNGAGSPGDGPSDLATLAERLTEAWASLGGRRPRDVWPDPLPEMLPGPLHDPRLDDDALLIGIADDPDGQRHRHHRWQLDGPLLAVGLPGSGTSTVLSAAVLAAASRWTPSELHVHIVDGGGGSLRALAGLPQVGAVILDEEVERQRRLFERLAAVLATNLTSAPSGPRRLIVIDGLGAFHDRWGDRPDGPWPVLGDLVRRGAAAGIHLVLSAEGAGRVPHQILSACRQRLVLRLSDRSDHATFGIPPGAVPDLPDARAIDPSGPTIVQIAAPARGLGSEVAALADRGSVDGGGPPPVGVLPTAFELGMLRGEDRPLGAVAPDGSLSLLVGVSDVGLVLARLVLPPAAHALVTGPPRSGRTTALATITAAAATSGRPVWWVGSPDRTPAGADHRSPSEIEERIDSADPILIAVDDADLLADDPVLQRIVSERRADRHIVAAARSDRLRGAWGSWLREVRVDRIGILLDPDRDLDGDLLGVRLPRELPVSPRTGLGWLVGEPAGFAQIALPIIT